MATVERNRQILTLREVAALLRISESTTRRLIDGHGLPALRVGGQIRVDRAQLDAWLLDGRIGRESA